MNEKILSATPWLGRHPGLFVVELFVVGTFVVAVYGEFVLRFKRQPEVVTFNSANFEQLILNITPIIGNFAQWLVVSTVIGVGGLRYHKVVATFVGFMFIAILQVYAYLSIDKAVPRPQRREQRWAWNLKNAGRVLLMCGLIIFINYTIFDVVYVILVQNSV